MKYRIVTIKALVPQGDDSFKDALGDYAADYPEQLVAWTVTGYTHHHLSVEAAATAWEEETGESLEIEEPGDDDDEAADWKQLDD